MLYVYVCVNRWVNRDGWAIACVPSAIPRVGTTTALSSEADDAAQEAAYHCAAARNVRHEASLTKALAVALERRPQASPPDEVMAMGGTCSSSHC